MSRTAKTWLLLGVAARRLSLPMSVVCRLLSSIRLRSVGSSLMICRTCFPESPRHCRKSGLRRRRLPPNQEEGAAAAAAPTQQDRWSGLISPLSIEDEVKRVRLHFDSVVTKPGDFAGGGYQDARLDLTVLATLFAVIHEHGGEVRWKDQAAAARDLIARTAFNCKAGSTQVYNEAKLRKADLQDLVSGGGISAREAPAENDWSSIAGRSPLMEYIEQLIDVLEDAARNEASVNAGADVIKRNSELLAMVGEVLVQEGMDEADDGDYVKFSRSMTEAAKGVTQAWIEWISMPFAKAPRPFANAATPATSTTARWG